MTRFPRRAALPRATLLAAGLLVALHANAQSADTATSGTASATVVAGTAPASPAADAAQATPATQATAPGDKVVDLGTVMVVARREDRSSAGATNLDLDIKDTPQSISVVDQAQMQQFGTTSLNDALRLSTGIQVDEWETNRTTFTSRGFDIENTQVDGVGLPNDWGIVTGTIDTYGYEKLEVTRGANGLLTGVGNAAGTINYVRKRPTNDERGSFGVSYGSWDTARVQADYSTPLTADGRWAARVVGAHEAGDSYLRGKQDRRDFLYGVVDGQVGANGTLTAGFSYQKGHTDGVMWGALAFMNSDGTQNDWPRDASTTLDWTYWDTTTENGFVEYAHQLGDWLLKLTYNHQDIRNDERMFYAYDGNGTGLDPATGEGLYGYAWGGYDGLSADLAAATLDGHFDLFGRDQELMLGLSWAKSGYTLNGYDSPDCGTLACNYIPMPGFPWAGNVVAEPSWGDPVLESTLNQRLMRAFGATRLSLTDHFNAVLGVNYARYHRDGNDYGVLSDQTEGHTSPYGGLTFDFNEHVLGYVSYSDIYQPQSQVGEDHQYLAATKGENTEIGVKADWLGKRLLTTLAVFKARQDGLATPNGEYNEYGQSIYIPVDVESKGVELEATGKLGDNVDLVFGYTALKLTGQDGDATYRWVPRRTANLLLSMHVPGDSGLSFGIGGRWQSAISNVETSGFTVRQGRYAVLNGYAAWDFRSNATLRLNVDNLGDEKYINTLRYSGFYGAPRNYTLSLDWRF
jgi:outer membrane receptor for ferric coprogen and ferric-rhodotorulic acid